MAEIILRNPKCYLSRNLIRLFSISTSDSNRSLRNKIKGYSRTLVRQISEPEKIAERFEKAIYNDDSFRFGSILDFSVTKLAKLKRFDLIEKVLEKQKESELAKSEWFWVQIIRFYSKVGMLDQAIRTYDQMIEEKKCEVSDKSFCALLHACIDNSRFDLVYKYFDEKIGGSESVVAHNLVMKAFIAEKKIDSARELFEKMEAENGLKHDVYSYNLMLNAYLNYHGEDKFDEVYKEFTERGLQPDVFSYNLRIKSLLKKKEYAAATGILDEMTEKGVKPNAISFNMVIDGLGNGADIESAMSAFKRMREEEAVSPNSETYNILIHHLVKEGDFESALEMCKESLENKLPPRFSVMTELVKGLVALEKVNEAKEIVENMKQHLRGSALNSRSWAEVEGHLQLKAPDSDDSIPLVQQ